jgi:hypothetical protein
MKRRTWDVQFRNKTLSYLTPLYFHKNKNIKKKERKKEVYNDKQHITYKTKHYEACSKTVPAP